LARGNVRPELPAFCDRQPSLLLGDGSTAAWVWRAHPDPGFERGDFRVRKLPVFRHLKIAIMVTHRLDQEALVRIAGNNGRTGITAGGPTFPGIEPQPALHLLAHAVAIQAMLRQQRADLLLKERLPWIGKSRRRKQREEEKVDRANIRNRTVSGPFKPNTAAGGASFRPIFYCFLVPRTEGGTVYDRRVLILDRIENQKSTIGYRQSRWNRESHGQGGFEPPVHNESNYQHDSGAIRIRISHPTGSNYTWETLMTLTGV